MKLGAYFASWQGYPGTQNYQAEDIPFKKLSTLYYAFLEPRENSKGEPEAGWSAIDLVDEQLSKIFAYRKTKNKKCQILLSVGTSAASISKFVANIQLRTKLISIIVDNVVNKGFDGCDIDWESSDRTENGTKFIKELRKALPKNKKLVLTTSIWRKNGPIDAFAVANICDWINIMAYDIAYPRRFDGRTCHNAPIGNMFGEDYDKMGSYGIKWYLDDWKSMKFPLEKLSLGFPLYGYEWKDVDMNSNPTGLYNIGIGIEGQPLYKNMIKLTKEGFTLYYDNDAQSSYLSHHDGRWFSIDTKDDFNRKKKLAEEYNLHSMFFWELSGDASDSLRIIEST